VTDPYVVGGSGGSITVSAGALTDIVRRSVERVGGTRLHRPRRGLEIEMVGGSARVQLELVARSGVVLPELARRVQAAVADALTGMCGVQVAAVDVSIEEIEL
jgi:uncharacterized alkaline shock family protein YloU